MVKAAAKGSPSTSRKPALIRLTPEQVTTADAYVFVTGRTFQDLAVTGLFEYLERLKLTPEQQKKLKALRG